MNNIENIQEYIPTVYVNDSEPDLDETNLNKTEQAIKRVTDAANKAIDALKQLDREKLALSAISNVLSDATDKVPSLALANTMQLAINDLNSNLTVKDISSAFSAISTYVASITAYQYGNVVFLTGTYTKNIPTGSISNIAVVINITDAKYYPIMYTSVDDITSGATADVPIKINAFVDPAGNIKAIATDALTSNKRFSVAYLIA